MSDDIRAVAYELSTADGDTIIIRSERHQVESYKHKYPTDLVNELVRKPEVQTQIAARDVEIVRLREALHGIIYTIHNLPEFMCIESIQKEAELALKGPEA